MTDFAHLKSLFHIPDGLVYLDGNSLGPMPNAALDRMQTVMQREWSQQLIKAWNDAHWFTQPNTVGDRVAKLIGAKPGTVVMGDTLSIKIHQTLCAALALNPQRNVILSDAGNFPTDLYIAQGLINSRDKQYEIVTPEPELVENYINDTVAVLLLTHVDYRTGRVHDMKQLTQKAHDCGVITIWDLAHSAGALPLQLDADQIDFAAGCTYKYLNGGPGAPAFIYVAPRHLNSASVGLSGWMGHTKPFAFDLDYTPAYGISRMRVGTPPVLALAVLEAAMDIWEQADIHAVYQQSMHLSELFIYEIEARCPELMLVSPRDKFKRGSQLSFKTDNAYAIMQALIASDVIGDFRQPDLMRFGFTPLYINEDDIMLAVQRLQNILQNRLWDKPEYKAVKAVT